MEMTLMPSGSARVEAFYVVLISILRTNDERKIVLNVLSSFLASFFLCEHCMEWQKWEILEHVKKLTS